MEERQISIDGETYKLPPPYFVLATQNPIETQGTFPLPEAQLDRFIMQITIGYPGKTSEADVIQRFIANSPLDSLQPVISIEEWVEIQAAVAGVTIHRDLCEYIANLAAETRSHESVAIGVSPRASIQLARAAQARAVMDGREFVKPEDIKYLVSVVWAHRLTMRGTARSEGRFAAISAVLAKVPVPTENIL